MSGNGTSGGLRARLDTTIAQYGGSLRDWTVLAAANDPYRQDVPRFREAGEWFAHHWERLGQRVDLHARGFHYSLLGQGRPGGRYENTDAHWEWIQNDAIDGARWLGLIPFDAIVDQRNAPPVRRNIRRTDPRPVVRVGGVEVFLPETLTPQVALATPREHERFAIQPFRLCIFGEKVSLEPVVGPIAARYEASLYLPTGEASDCMIYWMMYDAAEDGRPLRVFYLSDADPGGWQMAISVARKMQALRDLLFPSVEYEIHHVALTPQQAIEHDLPSTPLKDTEKRASAWMAAFGREQTEIDSLLTLKPAALRRILTQALDGFYDHSLDARVNEARYRWEALAQRQLEEQLGPALLYRMRADAEAKLADLEDQVREINEALTIDVGAIDLDPFEVPEPEDRVYGEAYTPIASSAWSYAEQTQALKARKAYEVPAWPYVTSALTWRKRQGAA